MLATFHYLQDNRWRRVGCRNLFDVEFHIALSRAGLAGGDEDGFFIEWN